MKPWILAIAVVAACGKGTPTASGKPKVAVSIFPLYDLVKRVAGDRLEVLLVLPPGRSEHGYDPTPQEIARLEGTKLAIGVGLDMDTWVESTLKGVAPNAPVFHVGDHVQTMPIAVAPIGADDKDKDADDTPGAPDPHVWMDPMLMALALGPIREELTKLDPAGSELFGKNQIDLQQSLTVFDGQLRQRVETWKQHTIVTFHGSMSYYAKRYKITIAAVVEPLAGKEPTAAYIAEVVAAIQRNHAAALFSEPQFDKAPAETIAREAKVPLGELDPVGGVPGRDSYEKLLTWDTDQLERLLK